MLDIGRKYFSPDDLFSLIDQMHELKFNLLHLHFSENERFGLESDHLKPENSQPILSKSQLTEVVDYATAKGMAVMGELGMPGHMGAILKQYPLFKLVGQDGQPIDTAINVADKEAVSLCKAMIQEFSPYFNSSYWHLGADEYLLPKEYANNSTLIEYARARLGPGANAQDGMLLFLNLMGFVLEDLGLRPRVWGDSLSGGSVIHLGTDFLIDWWTEKHPLHQERAVMSATDFAKKDHKLVNCSWDPCYYVMHPDTQISQDFPSHPDLEWAEQNWDVDHFKGSTKGLCTPLSEGYGAQFGGVKMQVWCDHPNQLSAADLIKAVLPQMQLLSKKYFAFHNKRSRLG